MTETMSLAGRINVFGMTLVFALLAADGTLDVVQAIVRIWRPSYKAGNPPLLLLVAVMSALTFCCVVLVSIIDPLSLSRRKSNQHQRRVRAYPERSSGSRARRSRTGQ